MTEGSSIRESRHGARSLHEERQDDGRQDERGLDDDLDLPLRVARDRWSEVFERSYLRELLAAHGGNVATAARAAGVACCRATASPALTVPPRSHVTGRP